MLRPDCPPRGTVSTLLVVTALFVSVALTGAAVGSPSASSSVADSAKHGTENGNYTVVIPEQQDHYPRDKNPDGTNDATVNHLSGLTKTLFEKAGTPKGTENASWIWIKSQDIDFSECTPDTTRAFGIDRDGDDPGTETDIDLLSYREDTIYNKHSIYVDFFESNEIAAPPRDDQGGQGEGQGEGREDGDANLEVYPDDQIISVQEDCYGMPEEPGWYQIEGYGNGTGFNGQFGQTYLPSHYFYICECDSEQEAREQLGPPPSEQDGEDGGDSDESTATTTETDDGGDTTPTDAQGDDSTPTDAQGDDSTPTDDGGGDTTPTDDGGGDTTPTDDTTTDGTPTDDATTDGTATTGTTDTSDDDEVVGGDGGDSGTPTNGDGPGFGIVAAFAALLGAGLLALRQRN
jgi:PGF-CTERM protein